MFDTWSGHILSFLLPLIQEGQLSVTGKSMCMKYWLGGLNLPRKSVVRLTDHPDMTLDVYRGCKTKMQCNYNYYKEQLTELLPSHTGKDLYKGSFS